MVIYLDATKTEEGDGAENNPFMTLKLALESIDGT